MPIDCEFEIKDISNAEFDLIDEVVMRSAYATHNKFGRLFDEHVYENNLATRLQAEGLDVRTQSTVTVSNAAFHKIYRLDMVVNHMLYEIKAVSTLLDVHKAQALNYAMLQNIRRVKLLNFGGPKVFGHLLRNAVSDYDRYQPKINWDGWRAVSPQCESLACRLQKLVADWGTHLSTGLYNEALIHHFGGEDQCLRRLQIRNGSHLLGTHPVQMHAPDQAFTVTALPANRNAFRRHLETLLTHTHLHAIQWINLKHSQIELTTLGKS